MKTEINLTRNMHTAGSMFAIKLEPEKVTSKSTFNANHLFVFKNLDDTSNKITK
jgi:fructose-1,6-bisphosphatase